MQNPTEKTIPGQTVTDAPAPAPTTEPKKPGRVKGAIKTTASTIKRHKTIVGTAAGVALGAVAVTLLSNRGKDEGESLDGTTEDVNLDEFPTNLDA